MRVLLLSAAFAAALIGVGMTHDAVASGNDKTHLCHFNGTDSTPATAYYHESYSESYGDYHYEYEYTYTYTYAFGRMIEVGESAADAHAAHGDSATFGALTGYIADYLATWDQYDASDSYTYDDGYYSYSYTTVADYTNGVVGVNSNCYTYSYTVN